MTPLHRTAIAIVSLLAVSACTEAPGRSGGFALRQLEGLARDSEPANLTSQTDFDLGDVKATRSFYFLLDNTGDADITNITLTSSTSTFAVEPAAISVLPPGGGAVVPIVRVSAVHGIAVDGVGFAPLMTPGMNTGTITITGTTMTPNGPEPVELIAGVRVAASVMDIELRNGTQVIDLTMPGGAISTNLGGLGFARAYFYDMPNGAEIENTGNIDITLTFYEDRAVIGQANASPGQTVPVIAGDTTTFVGVASGAVSDDTRLQLGNDGVAYFALTSFR